MYKPKPFAATRWLFWAGVLSSELAGCSAVQRLPLPDAYELPPPVTAVAPEDTDADAVALHYRGVLRFLSPTSPLAGWELEELRRVHILKPEGRRHASFRVKLSSLGSLERLTVRSYDAKPDARGNRNEMEAGVDQLSILPVHEGHVLYSDLREASLEVPGAWPGRIVEIGYVLRSRGPWGPPTWHFSAQIPVLLNELHVLHPPTWSMAWSYTEKDSAVPFEPTTEDAEGGTWLRFVQRGPRDIPGRLTLAVSRAPGGGTFANWQDVIRAYEGLIEGKTRLSPEAVANAAAFVRQHPKLSKEAALHRYVRDSIRYVAVEQGIGGIQPHSAHEVYASGYGDCKDKATLLIALLAHAGIRSYPMLVRTDSAGWDEPTTPSFGAFNHAIVALQVQGGYTFVDPTAERYEFGEIPWTLQGGWGLIIDPRGPGLIRMPVRPPSSNRAEVTWTLQSLSRFTLQLHLRGELAVGWRKLASASDGTALERRLRDTYLAQVPVRRIDHTSIDVDGDHVRVQVEGELRSEALNGHHLLRLGAFFASRPAYVPPPVHPRELVHEVVLPPALAARVVELPPERKDDGPWGSFALSSSKGAHGITVRRDLQLTDGQSPPAVDDLVALSARAGVVLR